MRKFECRRQKGVNPPRVDSIDEINRLRVIEELGLHADEAGKRRRGRIAGDKHFAASMPGYSDMDKIP